MSCYIVDFFNRYIILYDKLKFHRVNISCKKYEDQIKAAWSAFISNKKKNAFKRLLCQVSV